MNEWREVPPLPQLPHCRAFQKRVDDGHLSVLVGREPIMRGRLGWHLSISHRSSQLVTSGGNPMPGRIPTWEEICEARYRFVPDEVYMAMILPPRAEYVNVHPTTMHLHEIEGDQ
jgi:hypothetical protein